MYQRDDIEIKDAATLALAAYTAEREDVFVFNQFHAPSFKKLIGVSLSNGTE